MEKKKMFLTVLLVAVGVLLLLFGLAAKFNVASCDGQDPPVQVSEIAFTEEVARGGVTRDEAGEIKKTYGQDEEPPSSCAT